MGSIVSRPGEGERFERDNRVVTIRIDLPDLSVHEIEFDTSFEVSLHSHDDHVDAFYVLEGELELTVGDDVVRVGTGTLIAEPRGVMHGLRNPGPGRVRILNFHAPDAGFADVIRGT